MKRTFLGLCTLALAIHCSAQRPARPAPPATLGLEHGTNEIVTPDFTLRLGKDSGVAVGLLPKSGKGFDFLPSDRLAARASNGFVHLGDVDFRTRVLGGTDWIPASSYTKRAPVDSVNVNGVIAAENLARTLPEGCPLQVVRSWSLVKGKLQLGFAFKNRGPASIEIGALGIAMPFNNIITGRSLEEAHAKCSFTDPYIGEDAGYIRVTELNGVGPTMVVTPVGATPLEAWKLINEPMRPNQTFEGMMDWMVHTKAGRPVAVGIPGYVLPMDQDGKLFLKYQKGAKSIVVEPKDSLEWTRNRDGRKGWTGYTVHGKRWGRARLTVTYADGTNQVVSYDVIKPEAQAVSDLGHFLTTKSWFDDTKDPFGRAPSVISYDREADKQVTQDSRVWIAGLGDEGGSGSWVAATMKSFGQPKADEVAKLESFVDGVLWGNLQFKEGPNAYGVRKSVFFYDPKLVPGYVYNPQLNWTSWTSWSKKATDDVGRGYNYPHVVAAYWALYRVARNHPGMVKAHTWDWYLDQAYKTTDFLTSVDANGEDRVGYWRLGMMEGDVFVALLNDLRREGWTDKAKLIETRMKLRADRWKREAYPFGSEMAWDSTGQEEVYAWCKAFGYNDKALVSLNSDLTNVKLVSGK